MTYRTIIREGESVFEAICRAGTEANRLGETSYEIDCGKCGHPIKNHELPTDCELFQRELPRSIPK